MGFAIFMLCCLLTALLAGKLAVAARLGVSLLRKPGPALALALLGVAAGGLAIEPAVAEHGRHYALRAEAHQRSVLEEILAQPLCSGGVERP